MDTSPATVIVFPALFREMHPHGMPRRNQLRPLLQLRIDRQYRYRRPPVVVHLRLPPVPLPLVVPAPLSFELEQLSSRSIVAGGV